MFRSSQMLSSLLGDWIIVWLSLWRPSFANGCSKALSSLEFDIFGLHTWFAFFLWTFLEVTIGHRIKDEKNDKRNYQSYGDFDITCLGNRWKTTELFWPLMTMALNSHSEGKPHLAIWLVYPIRCVFFWLNFFCIRKN